MNGGGERRGEGGALNHLPLLLSKSVHIDRSFERRTVTSVFVNMSPDSPAVTTAELSC